MSGLAVEPCIEEDGATAAEMGEWQVLHFGTGEEENALGDWVVGGHFGGHIGFEAAIAIGLAAEADGLGGAADEDRGGAFGLEEAGDKSAVGSSALAA